MIEEMTSTIYFTIDTLFTINDLDMIVSKTDGNYDYEVDIADNGRFADRQDFDVNFYLLSDYAGYCVGLESPGSTITITCNG